MRQTFMLGICIGSLVAWISASSACADEPPTKDSLNSALLAAVRKGDTTTVMAQLERDADVDARDESGATALMLATLDADVAMMKTLFAKGADINAKNKAGSTALRWALHDAQKVKVLLDAGATPTDADVFVAVTISGAAPTLKLLASRGGKLNIDRQGYTTLMAAARGGDLDVFRLLIDQGADVKAHTRSNYTALYGAASWSASADIIRLLLDKGADPNAAVAKAAPGIDHIDPVMAAAMQGDAATLRLLLEKGAKVNDPNKAAAVPALHWAATTASVDSVRSLLAAGADVKSKDQFGKTALDWARLRGRTSIVELLEKAGAQGAPPEKADELPRLHGELKSDAIERSLAKALSLVQKSGQTFSARKDCVSCHHQALVAMSVGMARRHGIEIDEKAAKRERTRVLESIDNNRDKILQGGGVSDELLPAYMLAGLAEEDVEPNAATDALVQFLVLRQRKDGSWKTPVYRPPQDASDITFTALAVHGLKRYAPPGRNREMEERIRRAGAWLVEAKPHETEDETFRLLGLHWAGAEGQHVRAAVELLLREQHEDGGWAQLPTLESDAYATGQVLFALHVGGGLAVDRESFQRGLRFLLRTQLADGSWLVHSRAIPLQPHFETDFPHGKSQFISTAATNWAIVALSLGKL